MLYLKVDHGLQVVNVARGGGGGFVLRVDCDETPQKCHKVALTDILSYAGQTQLAAGNATYIENPGQGQKTAAAKARLAAPSAPAGGWVLAFLVASTLAPVVVSKSKCCWSSQIAGRAATADVTSERPISDKSVAINPAK